MFLNSKSMTLKVFIGFAVCILMGSIALRAQDKEGTEKAQTDDLKPPVPTKTSTPEKRLQSMREALDAMQSADYNKAESIFTELTKSDFNLLDYVHFYLGDLMLKTNRFPQAQQHFEKVLDLNPNTKLEKDVKYQLANMAMDSGDYIKAKKFLTNLEKTSRGKERYPDVIFSLAKAERKLKNQAQFCKWAKKLFVKYPQSPKISDWTLDLPRDKFENEPVGCQVSLEDKRNRIKALQWAGLAQKSRQEIDDLRTSAAGLEKFELDRLEVQFLMSSGEITKAFQLLSSYYEQKKSDVNYLVQMATVAARAGDVQAAVGSYYRAYKLSPRGKGGKQSLYQSAFLSYQFQDYDGAARKFQEFVKVYPTSGLGKDAKWHLAWIRYLKQDFQGAYQSLLELKKVDKRKKRKDNSVVQDRINYWLAMSLYRQNRYEEAKPLFENLAKDQLLGYYAIAAQFRLKKLEALLPKITKKSLREQTRRIARFSFVDFLVPIEGDAAPSEANESEDNIVLSPLAVVEEEPEKENEELKEVTGDGQIEVAEKSEESEPAKTSFQSATLVHRFERARDLMIVGLNQWSQWDLMDIESRTSNREYLKTLMEEYQAVGNYNRAAYIGQVFFGGQRSKYGIEGIKYMWEYTYPKAHAQFVEKYSQSFGIPTELIWGIMRAESQYRQEAISPVGALGLMQVMPSTGMKVAELMKDKGFVPSKLLEPETAIKIGSRYLSRLMKTFENSVPLVAASYNAGPHRTRAWLDSFGNLEMDEFIEHIPFLETRTYVKKVVSNFHIYARLYNQKANALAYLSEPITVKFTGPTPLKETWEDI